jgi:putative membrane protein
VYLVVAAVVLLVAGRFVPGLKVSGFMGAVVAAIAIAVVYWILAWLLGLFGIHI